MEVNNNGLDFQLMSNMVEMGGKNNTDMNINNSENIEGVEGNKSSEEPKPEIKGIFTLAEENKLPSEEEQGQNQLFSGMGNTDELLKLMMAMKGTENGSVAVGESGGAVGGSTGTTGGSTSGGAM